VFTHRQSEMDVAASALMERYGVPSRRVLGASPILGRPGLAKSPQGGRGLSGAPVPERPQPVRALQHSLAADGSSLQCLAADGAAAGLSVEDLRRIALPRSTSCPAKSVDAGPLGSGLQGQEDYFCGRRRRRPRCGVASSVAPQLGDASGGALGTLGSACSVPARAMRPSSTAASELWASGRRGLWGSLRGSLQQTGSDAVLSRRLRSLEHSDPELGDSLMEEEGCRWAGDDGVVVAAAVPGPSPSPCAGHGSRRRQNPFVEYEDREQRLQWERRWLLEDASYMAARLRGLQHNTIQARLGRQVALALGDARSETASGSGCSASVSESRGAGGGGSMHGHAGKQLKKHHAASVPQQLGTTMRRTDRNESPACVKFLKGMQKELKDSTQRVEDGGECHRPAPMKVPARLPGHLRSLLETIDFAQRKPTA